MLTARERSRAGAAGAKTGCGLHGHSSATSTSHGNLRFYDTATVGCLSGLGRGRFPNLIAVKPWKPALLLARGLQAIGMTTKSGPCYTIYACIDAMSPEQQSVPNNTAEASWA